MNGFAGLMWSKSLIFRRIGLSNVSSEKVLTQKDVSLEALRGVAAFTVLFGHIITGFFPEYSGLFPGFDPALSFRDRPWFALVNATSAVTFFFVLSGYVLTKRYLLTGDAQILARGAVKRWPRLAGPVLFVVLGSWTLFQIGAYHFVRAGELTGSPWLASFATGLSQPLPPSVFGAAAQGAFFTFFRGDYSYDSSTWTMRYELAGSFICFGAAALVISLKQRFTAYFVVLVVGIACHFVSPYLATFLIGLLLAMAMPRERPRARLWLSSIMLIAAFYLLGHTEGAGGIFALLSRGLQGLPAAYIASFGSVLLIVAVQTSPALHSGLQNRFCAALGTLSFPLYLVHVPVLCSLGSFVLVTFVGHVPGPRYLAALATIIGSVLIALPVIAFNQAWLLWIDRVTSTLVEDHPA